MTAETCKALYKSFKFYEVFCVHFQSCGKTRTSNTHSCSSNHKVSAKNPTWPVSFDGNILQKMCFWSLCKCIFPPNETGQVKTTKNSAKVERSQKTKTNQQSLKDFKMSTFESIPYGIKFQMEVYNYSTWILEPSGSFCESGYISSPPKSILPGSKGIVLGHKMANCATGACGVVSWNIISSKMGNEMSQKIAVMYSCPFNFNHYSNYLAVGIFNPILVDTDKQLFKRMYYDDGKSGMKKCRILLDFVKKSISFHISRARFRPKRMPQDTKRGQIQPRRHPDPGHDGILS